LPAASVVPGGKLSRMLTAANRRLALVGVAIIAATIAFSLLEDHAASSQNIALQEITAWAGLAIFAALYWHGWTELNRSREGALRVVIAIALILGIAGVMLPAFDSPDIYAYANIGWMQYRYHLNPYAHLIREAPGWQHDPMMAGGWQDIAMPYGFLFTHLTRLLAMLGGGHFRATLILFRLTNALACAAIAAMLYGIARRTTITQPEAALYLFLWNPIVPLEFLANGHNDILAGMFVVAAIYMASSQRWLIVIPALAAGFLMKYTPALIIPLALVYVLKRVGWLRAAGSIAIAFILFAAVAIPYIGERSMAQSIAAMREQLQTMCSFPQLFATLSWEAARAAGMSIGIELLNHLFEAAFMLGFAAVYLFGLRAAVRGGDANAVKLLRGAVLLFFVFICVARGKYEPWYIGVFFPIAVLLPPREWLLDVTILLTFSAIFTFSYFVENTMVVDSLMIVVLPILWVCVPRAREVAASIAGPGESSDHEHEARV
jgi:alpha-1,6-mannosyltransferase